MRQVFAIGAVAFVVLQNGATCQSRPPSSSSGVVPDSPSELEPPQRPPASPELSPIDDAHDPFLAAILSSTGNGSAPFDPAFPNAWRHGISIGSEGCDIGSEGCDIGSEGCDIGSEGCDIGSEGCDSAVPPRGSIRNGIYIGNLGSSGQEFVLPPRGSIRGGIYFGNLGSSGQEFVLPPRGSIRGGIYFGNLGSSGQEFVLPPRGSVRNGIYYGNLGSSGCDGWIDKNGIYRGNLGSSGCDRSTGGNNGVMPIDYVDAAIIGQRLFHQVDTVIPGRGIELVFDRTYRSRSHGVGPLGSGWTHAYEVRIERIGAAVVLHDGTGRSDYFRLQPDGTYGADGLFLEGSFASNGSFTFTFPDGGTWTFHPLNGLPERGKLRTSRDRNGNHIDFEYDVRGRLSRVRDTLDTPTSPPRIAFTYDVNDRITTMRDSSGRVWRYAYYRAGDAGGSPGDLESVTTPAVVGTPNGNDFPNGKTTTYTYSRGFADDRLNHNLLSVTDPSGQTYLQYVYTTTTNPQSFDFDRVARIVLGNANDDIDLVYVPVTPTSGIGNATMCAIVNDRVGNVREYYYDAANRLVRERDFTGRAKPHQPTTPTQNRPAGRLRASDPSYFEARWDYDVDSLPTMIVTSNGGVTQLTWEADLDSTSRRRIHANLRVCTRLPGPLGGDQTALTQRFEYNHAVGANAGLAFPTRTIDARGNVTLHSYDASGNRARTEHRLPTQRSIIDDWAFDVHGQPTMHAWPSDSPSHRRMDRFDWNSSATGIQRGYLKDAIVDAHGFALTTTFEHDALGRITRVVDPRGNDDLLEWNALDQIVRTRSREVTPGTGIRHERDFSYDANDNLVQVDIENRDESGALQLNSHFTSTYDYEILDGLVRSTCEVEDGVSPPVVTEYAYDANRNLQLVRFGEATNGHQPTNTLTLRHDERDLLFRSVRAVGDVDQSATRFDYDGNGNSLLVTEPTPAGAGGPCVKKFVYDGFNRLAAATDPMGNVATLHYDENGNVVTLRLDGELIDVDGSVANVRLSELHRTFDPMDRLTRCDRDWFDPTTQTNLGDGSDTTQWTWNGPGLLTSVIDDNGHATTFEHDSALRLHAVVDPRGNRRQFDLDANSNVVTTTATDLSDVSPVPEIFTTTMQFDGLDRRTRTIDNLGGTRDYGFDSRGNPVRSVDPLGNVVRYTYDGLNRRVRSEAVLTDDGTGSGKTIATAIRSWSFDASSRCIAATDPNGNTTTYGYDALDRRIQTAYADGTQSQCSYDGLDDPILSIDANGTSVQRSFDADRRCTHVAVSPGTGVSAQTTFEEWQYDGRSRIVAALNDGATVTRDYDSLGNRSHEVQDGAALSATHDGVGNVLTSTYSGGRKIVRTYDALDRAVSVQDAATGVLATYEYVGRCRMKQCDRANHTRTTCAYDGLRRVVSVNHIRDPGATNVLFGARSYTWDPRSSASSDADALATTSRQWTYDSIGRLVQSAESPPTPPNTIDYALDLAGNRTLVTGGSAPGAYVMDPALPAPGDFERNQYTTTPLDTRGYDANGNLVSSSTAAGPSLLQFDYANRLVLQTDVASGLTATYQYDAFGRRISKAIASGTISTLTVYHHDGAALIEECDGSGSTNATYVHRESPTDPYSPPCPIKRKLASAAFMMTRGGADYYLHGDAFGSVRQVTDATGNLVESYSYDDFGAPHFQDGSGLSLPSSAVQNPWLFHGMCQESYDGVDRYYGGICAPRRSALLFDPVVGRFINVQSCDSAGVSANPNSSTGNDAVWGDWAGSPGLGGGMGMGPVVKLFELDDYMLIGTPWSKPPGGSASKEEPKSGGVITFGIDINALIR